jgi:hypothetical protein
MLEVLELGIKDLDVVFEAVKHDRNKCQSQIILAAHLADELEDKLRQVHNEAEMLRVSAIGRQTELDRGRQVCVCVRVRGCPNIKHLKFQENVTSASLREGFRAEMNEVC